MFSWLLPSAWFNRCLLYTRQNYRTKFALQWNPDEQEMISLTRVTKVVLAVFQFHQVDATAIVKKRADRYVSGLGGLAFPIVACADYDITCFPSTTAIVLVCSGGIWTHVDDLKFETPVPLFDKVSYDSMPTRRLPRYFPYFILCKRVHEFCSLSPILTALAWSSTDYMGCGRCTCTMSCLLSIYKYDFPQQIFLLVNTEQLWLALASVTRVYMWLAWLPNTPLNSLHFQRNSRSTGWTSNFHLKIYQWALYRLDSTVDTTHDCKYKTCVERHDWMRTCNQMNPY